MPFPPPPRAPVPGVPAARPPPRRPGAPQKVTAPACALPGPSPPAAAGERRGAPERPEPLLSRSWPSATLKRPQARRAPGPAPPRTPVLAAPGRPRAPVTAGASPSPAAPAALGRAASGPGPDAAARFSLSLTPEAVLVVQRRHLEKQLLARPRRPLPAPSADARRLLGPGARARPAGARRGGDPGGPDTRPPRGLQASGPGPQPVDLRRVLKVSLLNDRHKYDDVEYEEEPAAPDERLVRKCTEWLRGVQSAATARGRTGPLDALPHLGTL